MISRNGPDRTRPAAIALGLALLAVTVAGAQSVPEEDEAAGFREGRGEYEMVLIHGLGGSSEIWDEVLPYLKGTFTVRTFELSGHGTTQPVASPTIAGEAERLGQFLEDEDLPYPTLVGHGLGGLIALRYTLDHPADVHRLIVMDTAPRQLADQEQKDEVTEALREDYDRFVARRYLQMSPKPEVTEVVLDLALKTDSASFISLLRSSFDLDMTDELPTMSVPLLVIGSELMFPSAESSRDVLDRIGFGHARSLSFKRLGLTGHYMMLERPVYLASVLLAFGVTADHRFEEH